MYSVIAFDGQVYGPVDLPTLISWCQQGRIVAGTHLVETNTGRTFQASDMMELRSVLAQTQASHPQMHQGAHSGMQQPVQNQYDSHGGFQAQNPYGASQFPFPSGAGYPTYGAGGVPKSKGMALFLCFLGFHRFYLGHTLSAVVFLVLELLAFTNCFCFILVAIWGTIDFFRIVANQMPDSRGVIPV